MLRCTAVVLAAVLLLPPLEYAQASTGRVVSVPRARIVNRARVKKTVGRLLPGALKRGLKSLATPGNLRASLMGLSDGITSTFGVVVATSAMVSEHGPVTPKTVLLASGAAMIAGASSMAAGEFSSVSYDNEQGLAENAAHRISSPQAAAGSSFVSFLGGAIIPLAPIAMGMSDTAAIATSGGLSVVTLVVTGRVLARMSGSSKLRSTFRLALAASAGALVSWAFGGAIGG